MKAVLIHSTVSHRKIALTNFTHLTESHRNAKDVGLKELLHDFVIEKQLIS